MKSAPRLFLVFGYLVLTFVTERAFATQYVGVDVYPIGSPDIFAMSVNALAISGGQVTGQIAARNTAVIWNLPSGVATALHPEGIAYLHSLATGTDGISQVGEAVYTGTFKTHAVLWHGVANSIVDLHPTLLTDIVISTAGGVKGVQQVGTGYYSSGIDHALLWHGTPESAVDLHPSHLEGVFESGAVATDGSQQVGYINRDELGITMPHAVVWNGTALSAVDLHPAGYAYSSANGVGGGQQAGSGNLPNMCSTCALLWSGTAESVVNLHPTNLSGYSGSIALATDGLHQAGYGQFDLGNGGGVDRALLWAGSADSAVDLHALLPPGFYGSTANSIDAQGVVWGFAYDLAGTKHAVKWTPVAVPEPTIAAMLVSIGLACLVTRRKKASEPAAIN